MATLLYVKTSLFGDNGQSSQLAEKLIGEWRQRNPQGQVVVRDLIAEPVPHLDAARIGALFSAAEGRTAEQQAVLDFADQLLDEVRAADLLVVGVPMYNFGIPTQMKAWFDHLARAGVTFKYTENGPVGLLEDKPVFLLATRGGLYKDSGVDFQIPFVKQFFSFIGLNDTREIYAEGLNMGDELRDQSLAQAREALAAQLQ